MDEVPGVSLDGPGLPDGRGETGDGDLHQALVVVVPYKVGRSDERHDHVQDLGQIGDHVTILQAEQVTGLRE